MTNLSGGRIALLFLSAIHFCVTIEVSATGDVSDAFHAYRASRYGKMPDDAESSAGVRGGTSIGGIYRGEASSVSSEQDEEKIGETKPVGSTRAGMNDIVDIGHKPESCAKATESILAMNEDIRLEVSAVDKRYLENASIEDVCDQHGKDSNCSFDFRRFPSKLQDVCERHGDKFYETEHSIQCYNAKTKESLYYQFDHYPGCFSAACEELDVEQLMADRIESITQIMSGYLGMTCFADDEILRHADEYSSMQESSMQESSGVLTTWRGVQMLPIAVYLLL